MNEQLRSSTIAKGRTVLRIEGQAVADLEARIGESFADAVDLLLLSTGRAVVTGVGKSGIVARKIVATLNSTGTPSMFLHPTDAVHGDLGMVRRDDVVICISKSGDTPELQSLLPMFLRIGVPIIALVGNLKSALARSATVVLDASVAEEACPHDLAPTASTTATLALGDALAVALLERRQFSREDFALFHPGGVLGRRLLLRVDEMMVSGEALPRVAPEVPLRDAIVEMTTKRLGCTCVVGGDGRLEGIITDGDLRRLLQRADSITSLTAGAAMTRNPKTIPQGTLAVVALAEMESYSITQIVVVDGGHRPAGVLHLHELVKAGIAGEESG
jgi:arabinose-5-phosphate isomerase